MEKNLEKDLADCRNQLSEICLNLTRSNDQSLFVKFRQLFARMSDISKHLEDVRRMESASIIRHADVVGLTTSGASKYRHLVQMIDAKVVIVEEAGQVIILT